MKLFRGMTALIAFVALFAVASVARAQQPQNPPAQQAPPEQAPAPARAGKVVVPLGTHLPLVLHNSISTRSAKPGDAVYLETLFPILIDGRIVIPAGSYVSGEVVETKRPGRVKGRGELMVRLNLMILPNGYTVNFNAMPTAAGTGGDETVEGEGKIKGDTEKGSDAGVVLKTTALSAGIGTAVGRAAGNTGRGAGIGVGAGAAAGLISVLATRGPEVELPRGTTLDVVLNRALYLDSDKVQFTDPGRASTLAGPPNRKPVRTRFPF
jgi:type IV secretion system protein VirB10